MGIYDDLKLKTVINGDATLTTLGGSLMPMPVIRAMMEAARSYVDLREMQARVGEQIAQMTGNEAAFVTTGAAAGIYLAAAACMAGEDPEKASRLPDTAGMKNEFIVQKPAVTEHDHLLRRAGGKIVSVGTPEKADLSDLQDAFTRKTAALFLAPKGDGPPGTAPIKEAIEAAKEAGIRVIVDAAAQLPPYANLWRFTVDYGADAAIFSGGKGLRGPQSTGVLLGKPDIMRACAFHSSPNPRIGRTLKVGKEELAGIWAAVREYILMDHDQLEQQYEEQVRRVVEAFQDVEGVEAERDFPSEAGQPMPRALIRIDQAALGLSNRDVLAELRSESPPIMLAAGPGNGVYVNPQTLRVGEEQIVANRLRRILLTRRIRRLTQSRSDDDIPVI
ncbi:MAG: aminotransferase class V-fold PLP-dependent enzyme [Candidatus Poribacteria bacterium]|nr:aminotransferase class V-fold PLP-dependent enzyme [Candidatus Poribacteria bacterium]